jgi:hypothetical protein
VNTFDEYTGGDSAPYGVFGQSDPLAQRRQVDPLIGLAMSGLPRLQLAPAGLLKEPLGRRKLESRGLDLGFGELEKGGWHGRLFRFYTSRWMSKFCCAASAVA